MSTVTPLDSQSPVNFFDYFDQQSQAAYGGLNDPHHKTKETEPLFREYDEYVKEARESAAFASTVSAGQSSPPPIQVVKQTPPTSHEQPTLQPTQQQFSDYREVFRGNVPPGLKCAACCANCWHYDAYSPGCCKHDFRCEPNYVCDDYLDAKEELESLLDKETQTYSVQLDLTAAPEESIEKLADVVPALIKHKLSFNPLEGKLPVVDKDTAALALTFRHYLADPTQKQLVIKLAANYAPDLAQQAQEEDVQPQVVAAQDKQPASPSLYKLAYVTAQASDPATVYQIYEDLYQRRHGAVEGCYLSLDTPAQPTEPVVTEQPEQTLADMGGASVSAPAYTGGTEVSLGGLPLYNNIYGIAEKRVKQRAQKNGTTFTQDDVLAEYKRVLTSRGKI